MQTRERVMKKIILISLLVLFVGCNSKKWSLEDDKACFKETKQRMWRASDKAVECHCDWLEEKFDKWGDMTKIDGERENVEYCTDKYPQVK